MHFLCYLSCKYVEVIVITASTVQMHEAVVVYHICVLDIHVSHPFLTHPTLKFGIHSQVTF